MLLAETNLDSTGIVGGLVGASGGIGFAIWYGWYVTTKTVPKLVSDFREERQLDRAERKQDRDEFKSAIRTVAEALSSVPCQQPTPRIPLKPLPGGS
jgi:hypothetical protein